MSADLTPQTEASVEAAPVEAAPRLLTRTVMKTSQKMTWLTRIYVPMLLKGLMISLREFIRKPITFNYPEQKPKVSERFRGEHRLTKDDEGKMKCVACYMCATACPAHCITIEAEAAPPDWDGRDKIPRVFEIDMLKCIYCGYCVEACPKEAIEMTNKVPQVYQTRQEFIYDREKLLNN